MCLCLTIIYVCCNTQSPNGETIGDLVKRSEEFQGYAPLVGVNDELNGDNTVYDLKSFVDDMTKDEVATFKSTVPANCRMKLAGFLKKLGGITFKS